MNKLQYWLIRLIANGNMVIINATVNTSLVKEGASVAFYPLKNARFSEAELTKMAVLTPTRNYI
jgi:hypothetical protein